MRVDDAYLGGERTGGKAGRGSENKVAFVAALEMVDGLLDFDVLERLGYEHEVTLAPKENAGTGIEPFKRLNVLLDALDALTVHFEEVLPEWPNIMREIKAMQSGHVGASCAQPVLSEV